MVKRRLNWMNSLNVFNNTSSISALLSHCARRGNPVSCRRTFPTLSTTAWETMPTAGGEQWKYKWWWKLERKKKNSQQKSPLQQHRPIRRDFSTKKKNGGVQSHWSAHGYKPTACLFLLSSFFRFSSYYIFWSAHSLAVSNSFFICPFQVWQSNHFCSPCLMPSPRCLCGLDWDVARQNKHTSSWSQDLQIPVGCDSNLTQQDHKQYERKSKHNIVFLFTFFFKLDYGFYRGNTFWQASASRKMKTSIL